MSEQASVAWIGQKTLCVRRLLAAATLTALAGCGGGGASSTSTDAGTPSGEAAGTQVERLPPVPRAVLRRCQALAATRRVAVLCPGRLPEARWTVSHQTLRSGPCAYLLDLDAQHDRPGEVFHVLAGGRCGEFPLRTTNGRWPADTGLPNGLGLVGAKSLEPGEVEADEERVPLRVRRETTIAGHPALLLDVEGYPDGGVHGGHLAAVWNQGGAGYALTLHFAPDAQRTAAEQEAVVRRAAEATSTRKGASPTSQRPNGSVQASVTPRSVSPADPVRVAITASRPTGVAGDTIRHYTAYVDGPAGAGCVQDRDVRFPPSQPGERVEVRIDPARRGPGKRWCAGTFTGRVVYLSGYRCPARGECEPPSGFPTERETVGRFTFRVRG